MPALNQGILAALALSTANKALHATQVIGLPFTGPLVDNTPLGSFWVRTNLTVNVADTSVPIKLGRKPTAYIVVRSSNGAVVFDGTTPAAWNGQLITLRATAATVVSVLIG